jgi:hypothetical protein
MRFLQVIALVFVLALVTDASARGRHGGCGGGCGGGGCSSCGGCGGGGCGGGGCCSSGCCGGGCSYGTYQGFQIVGYTKDNQPIVWVPQGATPPDGYVKLK